jgi:hypothetical protein
MSAACSTVEEVWWGRMETVAQHVAARTIRVPGHETGSANGS